MVKELKDLRIIFMGTPLFAVASLDQLVKHNANIVAVITAPDKPAGRGLLIQKSAVKQYAEEKGMKILQPEKLKDPDFIKNLRELQADIQVVVAFRMLPEVVWNMPPLGTVNVHGSLLPQYRGAAPINWAIINGEKFTGVTTFKLKHEIDTGDILLSQIIDIGEDEDAGSLHDRMMIVGGELIVKTLTSIAESSLQEKPQLEYETAAIEIKHAPKLFKSNCLIDWTRSVSEIYNLIRGLSPNPTAYTSLDGKTIKLLKVEKIIAPVHEIPGTYITDKKTYLQFNCNDGYINVLELQMEGKKRLPIKAFLSGYHFKPSEQS